MQPRFYRNTLFAFFFHISIRDHSEERVTRNLGSVITSPFTRIEFPARAFRTSHEVEQNQIVFNRITIFIDQSKG